MIREFITDFRECKTQQEEREFVNQQRAIIRQNIKNWGLKEKANAIL